MRQIPSTNIIRRIPLEKRDTYATKIRQTREYIWIVRKTARALKNRAVRDTLFVLQKHRI
jgi:hypothetical protein